MICWLGPSQGLGIGSLALAFGVKKVIEDMCLTMILLVRRPFNVGDAIAAPSAGIDMATVSDSDHRVHPRRKRCC